MPFRKPEFHWYTSVYLDELANTGSNSTGSVIVFPNPVVDHAFIHISGNLDDMNKMVFELYNVAGQVIRKQQLASMPSSSENNYEFERAAIST